VTIVDGAMLGQRLGAGREADVYAVGDAKVLKLYHPGFGGHRTEAVTLRALEGRSVAPKLLDVVEIDGRAGLVLERLAGPDMLTRLQRRPWQVHAVAVSLAEAHLAVHRVKAPVELADLREVLEARIREAELTHHLLGFASRVLDGLPDGDGLCHGDYHPGNVLLGKDRTGVIDWGAAMRGVAEADHARTLLLLRWADPLPGTSLVSRAVIAAGRSLLAATYARVYRRGSPPLRHTRSWLVVHVAARLSEGIPAERDIMIGRLERMRRRHSI
jgi:aminoglycoside phosphotransferase (APT) family kinase protein